MIIYRAFAKSTIRQQYKISFLAKISNYFKQNWLLNLWIDNRSNVRQIWGIRLHVYFILCIILIWLVNHNTREFIYPGGSWNYLCFSATQLLLTWLLLLSIVLSFQDDRLEHREHLYTLLILSSRPQATLKTSSFRTSTAVVGGFQALYREDLHFDR